MNIYKWYKNGVIYWILIDNRILFIEVIEEDEGSYYCEIINFIFDLGIILSIYII